MCNKPREAFEGHDGHCSQEATRELPGAASVGEMLICSPPSERERTSHARIMYHMHGTRCKTRAMRQRPNSNRGHGTVVRRAAEDPWCAVIQHVAFHVSRKSRLKGSASPPPACWRSPPAYDGDRLAQGCIPPAGARLPMRLPCCLSVDLSHGPAQPSSHESSPDLPSAPQTSRIGDNV